MFIVRIVAGAITGSILGGVAWESARYGAWLEQTKAAQQAPAHGPRCYVMEQPRGTFVRHCDGKFTQ